MFEMAYGKLHSNPGDITPGINPTTLDGLSEKWIEKTVISLKNEFFKFLLGRRVNIPKPRGDSRPLTVISSRDKIVMEVMRLILEAVYKPTFSPNSHGFRSGKSCHPALRCIREKFGVANWYIEGDIEKCFDSISHHRLIILIELKILDRKFTRLVWKSLRAGYFEFKTYQNSIIRTPPGSVISPILANIYMDQLDKYVEELITEFNKGISTIRGKEYSQFNKRLNYLRKRGTLLKKDMRKLASQMRKCNSRNPFDSNFRRLVYVRYSDDWILGVCGSRKETFTIKEKIDHFLKEKMDLILAKNKTLITHASTGKTFFLRIYIFKARHQITRRSNKSQIIRNFKDVRLKAPIQYVIAKLTKANFVRKKKAGPRFIWLQCSLDQIIVLYNNALRGYTNYYSFVNNQAAFFTYIYYLLKSFCAKLIATKYKLNSQRKVFIKYGKNLIVNKEKNLKFYKPSYKVQQ